jgi:hypothetical protein
VYKENRSWASDGENGEPALGGGIPSQFAEEMTDDGNMSVSPKEEDGQADQSANSQDVSQMSQDGSQQQ